MSRFALISRAFLIGAVVAVLAGCAGGQSDLQSYINDVKARPGEPIEPLPRVIPPEPFEYAVADLRDPFSGGPFDEEQITDDQTAPQECTTRPDPVRRREVLEGYELDSLAMVGTILIAEDLFGLIADPDGLIHRVQPSNHMGRNHGRVVAVYDDRLDLQEMVPDGTGCWMYRDAKVALDDS